MKKALFLDRDGTIIVEPPEDRQVDSLEKLRFLPGVILALYALRHETPFTLVMVSNQDGLGTAAFPEASFSAPHEKMLDILKGEGIDFDDILIDPSLPREGSPNRKPGIGMMERYRGGDYDMEHSWVIGDRETDVQFARNLGCNAMLIGTSRSAEAPDFHAPDWPTAARFLLGRSRTVTLRRKTAETDIQLVLNPDGRGETAVSTGIGFFDHMLEQLGFHSGCDLQLTATGDLHVDEHHTIEDTALVLGEAFRRSLTEYGSVGRYGFYLPMDESSCRAAIDLSGRPCLVWHAPFRRETIGGIPVEMFRHFFKSFSDACRCTLHIHAEGENGHHIIESIFKAAARSLRTALSRNPGGGIPPSTKGVLS
ncbi:bifunctional histidinol-phosphatase/imidazoleglycerol-phosphate dehydratase HisB [bacterium]|nr:bifunctional histidinol-phosphatase/imidazoleglycerol-phosphate dehydratase HisB [bacterium]